MGLRYDKDSVLGIQLATVNGGTWDYDEEANCNVFNSDYPNLPPKGFMNAYEANLASGGPEEGGWWFETGTPLASIPFGNYAEAEAAFNLLERQLKGSYNDGRSMSSVISEGDLRIVVENHFAEAYPSERPHYE